VQRFDLVIKYKKITNKIAGMLSRPPATKVAAESTVLQLDHLLMKTTKNYMLRILNS
jgi:hypothetical protein